MLEFKVQDLRLRGRAFTLHPAADEHGVRWDLMDALITAKIPVFYHWNFCIIFQF